VTLTRLVYVILITLAVLSIIVYGASQTLEPTAN
jgi:hypothetical protein